MITKTEAVKFFAGRNGLSVAIGCTPQAISDWPEVLPDRVADRVIAAAARSRREIPEPWLSSSPVSIASGADRCLPHPEPGKPDQREAA